ncbi:hypothetical protein FQ775_04180 [Nitratireductor mangrovi]|uniref:PepSY domain-containing protein n=1 Tax=Nitratireductor mangrovi TaxID=2599600 RepID=A0A5B8KVQ5_9HYPH|nr:hypothetical protein [Nitratireductor mangrovi]QDY99635.1 hypothetical protein FQ775_04180 [Nitratireductor mangrovi]
MLRKAFSTSHLALLAMALPAIAQSTDPAWLDQVAQEIAAAEQCEVGYFIKVREYELGGRRVYEARVQCVDGRQFDASRAEPDPTFSFAACEVRVC